MSSATLSNNLGPSSWFDAFRDNGGPVLYSSMNRTPVVEDIRNILIYIFFTTFFVAFLIIFPGIRKERCSTFICVTTSLFIGAVILISNCGSNWHVSKGSIASPYRAFSKEKIYANVGVHIGLDSVNITLRALPIHERSEDINYNERFYWIGANQMKQEFQRALAKGLPYPILTISEYLSIDGEGFNWGRHYRIAGYYTSITLWLAFASWILMNILLCAVPRYGAYTMQLTGALMLLSNLLYVMMIPAKPLRIPFEGSTLTFTYGWCFWLVFSAGLTAVFIGATVSIVDILFPNKFSTILEVDYDTPYRYFVGNDIHIIGSLPPPLNAYYYHHQHQSSLSTADSRQSSSHHLYQKKKSTKIIRHYSASKTASISTDSSCCPPSTTMTHRILAKTRSDASTSTREDSIIISDSNEQHQQQQQQQLPVHHYSNENVTELAANHGDMEQMDSRNHNDNPVILVSNYSQDSVQRTSQLINHHHHHQPHHQQPPNYESTFDDDEDHDVGGGGKQYAFENQAYQVDDPQVDDHGDDDAENLVHSTNHLFIDELADTAKATKLTKKESITINNNNNDVVMHHNSNNNDQNEDDYVLTSTPTPLVRQSSSSSAMASTTDDEQDDANESDVSTTIIDGKRAISLSNFGKFAEHREKHGNGNGMMMMGATFGHPMASAGFRAIKNGFSKRIQKHHPHPPQQQQQLQHQSRIGGGRRSRKQDPSSSASSSSTSSSMSPSLQQQQNKLMISNTSFSVGGGNGVNSSFQTSSLSSPLASTSSSSSSSSSTPTTTTTTTTTTTASAAAKKSLSSSVRVDLSSSAAMW